VRLNLRGKLVFFPIQQAHNLPLIGSITSTGLSQQKYALLYEIFPKRDPRNSHRCGGLQPLVMDTDRMHVQVK